MYMKQLLILLIFLFSFGNLVAQNELDRISIYYGFDVVNAFKGGKTFEDGRQRNPRALDLRFGATATYSWWNFGLFGEVFPEIDYWGAGLQVGPHFIFEEALGKANIMFLPEFELTYVNRNSLPDEVIPKYVTVGDYVNYGFSLKTRVENIWEKFPMYVELQGVVTFRYDIKQIWGRKALPSGVFPALWDQRSIFLNFGYYLN